MSWISKIFERWFSGIEECEGGAYYRVTIKEGDSLWALAADRTGNGERWHELVAANPDREFDRDYTLKIGEKLNIPRSWAPD